ncbi:hypothetical protein ACH42_02470 [Endozoicomonas sp. (ex Bugula neritina AB1)]|nr:hypothetical protein ACH42_02470 [Endozoicomonas sp. (ex Bugula neritina AB1)]
MSVRELTISTRYLDFAALEFGDPKGKPVLALHGWMDNAASFIPVAEHLQGIRLIAIDLAGHGLSDHRPKRWSYDIWHYVEDLVDIVVSLKLNSFGLIGHSMGAVICTMAAATVLKKQVSAMVLIDGLSPTPRLPSEAPKSLELYITQRQMDMDSFSVPRYRTIKQAIRARAIGQYKVSREAAELLVTRGLCQQGEEWLWRSDYRLKLASPARFTREQSLAFIHSVECPTQMIYAENGELRDVIADNQDEMPNIAFHPLSGTHHLHMDGQVDKVASIANAALS